MSDALTLAVAYVLAVVAVARLTRLVTSDDFPPVAWLRLQWERRTTPGKWQELATCPFCFAPYAAAGALALAVAADIWTPDLGSVAGWWWMAVVWGSGSYLASMIVLRDEPPEEG